LLSLYNTQKSTCECLNIGKYIKEATAATLPNPLYACPASTPEIDRLAFDSDSFNILVDTGSSITITPHRSDFLQYSVITGRSLSILGVDNIKSYPTGKGTVKYKLFDDNGQQHELTIENALHLPEAPTRIMCPQQWAQQRLAKFGDTSASCTAFADRFLLQWYNNGNYTKTLPLTAANLGILSTVPGVQLFSQFAHSTHTPGLFFNTPDLHLDEAEMQVTTNHESSAKKVFEHLSVPPTNALPLRNSAVPAEFLSDNTFHMAPTADDKMSTELMLYHEKLGHLSWPRLRLLALQGLIPK
jgi:hypothetical protein